VESAASAQEAADSTAAKAIPVTVGAMRVSRPSTAARNRCLCRAGRGAGSFALKRRARCPVQGARAGPSLPPSWRAHRTRWIRTPAAVSVQVLWFGTFFLYRPRGTRPLSVGLARNSAPEHSIGITDRVDTARHPVGRFATEWRWRAQRAEIR